MKCLLFLLCWLGILLTVSAKGPANVSNGFKISCVPESHIAKVGDKIEFTITSTSKTPCRIDLTVDAGRIIKRLNNVTAPQKLTYITKFPGFIQCKVSGKGIKAMSAVAVSPEKIRGVGKEPADYDQFWKNTFAQSAKLPLDLKEEKLEYKGDFNCYVLSCANINGKRAYGLFAVPKNVKKRVPLVVTFGGGEAYFTRDGLPSSARRISKVLKRDVALLMLHLPPYTPEKDSKSARKRHKEFLKELGVRRYIYWQYETREGVYARSGLVGCIRLLDAVAARKDIDAKNIVFNGSSHGGKFGAYLACFSKHIKAAFCGVPSSCEYHAFKDGRRSSIPGIWKKHLNAVSYYDLLWCAPRIKCPILVSVGFVDSACPPTGVYAFYNALKCPKQMYHKVEYGHGGAPEDYSKTIWKFLADNIARK